MQVSSAFKPTGGPPEQRDCTQALQLFSGDWHASLISKLVATLTELFNFHVLATDDTRHKFRGFPFRLLWDFMLNITVIAWKTSPLNTILHCLKSFTINPANGFELQIARSREDLSS